MDDDGVDWEVMGKSRGGRWGKMSMTFSEDEDERRGQVQIEL
jgi:hypothetical protein